MRRLAVLLVGAMVAAVACGGKTPSSATTPPLPLGAETPHYAFYYVSGDSVNADWQETYHAWATARLGVSLGRKIGYYKYRSRQDMGDHTGNYNTNGFADSSRMEIHTLWPTDNHEVVHLFMSTFGQSTALFSEGVAVAFQTDPQKNDFESRFNGQEIHAACRGYLSSGQLVLPLSGIVETAAFRAISDSTLSYREAGSFVRFLIDRYGLDRFLAFYRSGVTPNDSKDVVRARFATTIGVSLDEAEAAWLAMLRAGS